MELLLQKFRPRYPEKFCIYPEKFWISYPKILDISRKNWIYPEFVDPKILDIISENSGYINFCFLARISDMSQNSRYIQNSGDSLFSG